MPEVEDADKLEEFVGKLREDGDGKNDSDSKSLHGEETAVIARVPTPIGDTVQWSMQGNDTFRPCGQTTPSLPPAVYGAGHDNMGLFLEKKKIITDSLIVLPDTASERVLLAIQTFWGAESRFRAKGQIFKRGVMLWGPPGSGKTVTVMLLVNDIVRRGGIVLITTHPSLSSVALTAMRRIEPKRPVICVLEDIDELVDRSGEHDMLALLDGENQVDNVVYLATTNYPEKLDKRLVNRPSRFDEVIYIGMPSPEARRVYLRARLDESELSAKQLEKWVEDTKDLSIAHLREMVVAVFCLGREYDETLVRLKTMSRTISSSSHGKRSGFMETEG